MRTQYRGNYLLLLRVYLEAAFLRRRPLLTSMDWVQDLLQLHEALHL